MTAAADEQVQRGSGDFRDVVDVQLLDHSLLVAARIARAPSQESATVTALVLADGEPVLEIDEGTPAVESWEHAVAGPLALGIEQPLERWTLSLDARNVRMNVELRALTTPADLAEAGTSAAGRVAGLQRYTQLCQAQGTAEIAGRRHAVDALALRTHRWGPVGEAGRTRFLTAATTDGTLLTLAAVRSTGAAAHGEELVGGQSTRAGEDGWSTLSYETVRLSTVFGETGQPVKVGAELFRPGDEFPSRLAGVAAGGVSTEMAGSRASVTLFRLRLDGVPSFGAYEIEEGS